MKEIEGRKADHVQIAIEENVGHAYNYWDDITLIHHALPEVDMEEIDTSVRFLGRKLAFPLIITAITGGYGKAEVINRHLAQACERLQIGLGLGSQRAAIEEGGEESYSLIREYDIPLRVGNIGAPQLIGQRGRPAITLEEVHHAAEMVDAHCMAVHLNYLQEMVQPEGDTRALGVLEAIRRLAREMPIVVKETGAGISPLTAQMLKGAGVVAIDVSGTGGTSFSAVEKHRAIRKGEEASARLGDTFREWGIPAPVSLIWADVGLPLIASGGIRGGLDMARGMALGASCAGMARPLVKAALESAQEVEKILTEVQMEFRAAMFLCGCSRVEELTDTPPLITGRTREWLEQGSEEVF